jgi:cytochrome c-type biogenesis protein CcmH
MRLLCGLLLALCAGGAMAVIETYEFTDDALLERYQVLSAELRCPKCQNQNIADSNAPIAADLRKQLHEQLEAGRSNDEIVDYMVQRYGEFVLYRPRWNPVTMVLWLAPLLLLALAVGVLVMSLRRRADPARQEGLSGEEQRRLDELLDNAGSEEDVTRG